MRKFANHINVRTDHAVYLKAIPTRDSVFLAHLRLNLDSISRNFYY